MDGKDTINIVQVIDAARESCPIARFTVMGNCQLCMGKTCQNSRNFGVVSMERDRVYIDPDKCKECKKCTQVCPYNAITDLTKPCRRAYPVDAITVGGSGLVEIDESKCIQYRVCIHGCSSDVIGSKPFMMGVIGMIYVGEKVVAMAAPATEG